MIPAVAQTNLQLLNRLGDLGWDDAARARVAAAYALASELFSGARRASQKCFVEHLVGTAAIVAEAGGTVDETVAALLHAVYTEGDFGDGWADGSVVGSSGVSDARRAEVRATAGPAAEAIVADYGPWPWPERIADLVRDGAGALSGRERPVALVRIANEIEEHVDDALAYVPERSSTTLPLADAVTAAEALGSPALAAIARRVADHNAGCTVPATLRPGTDAPRWVLPRSATPRLRLRLRPARTLPGRVLRRARRLVSRRAG